MWAWRSFLAGLFLTLVACGGADRNRPVLVSTEPASGSSLADMVAAIRVTYDGPVTLLNRNQVSVTAGTAGLGFVPQRDFTDPNSILLYPAQGFFMLSEERHVVQIAPGLVINADEQYALDPVAFDFVPGPGSNLFLGLPGADAVAEADRDTYAFVHSTPTPGARDPVAVAGSQLGGVDLVWVQLATGGPGDDPIAYFAPGAAAMTTVPLSLPAGASLVAEAPAMFLTRDGRTLFTAFREEPSGIVRVHRVDVATQTETLPSLELSPAPSPVTAPLGMHLSPDGTTAYVACRTNGDDRLVGYRTVGPLSEFDIGPDAGTDGVLLPLGAGAVGGFGGAMAVGPVSEPNAHVTFSLLPGLPAQESPSTVSGSPGPMLSTLDNLWVIQGLTGFTPDMGFVNWTILNLGAPQPTPVSDLVGMMPTGATSVTALAWIPGAVRFVAVLDGGANPDVVVTYAWTVLAVEQEDLDPATDGIQAIQLPPQLQGATSACYLPGFTPN